MLPRANFPKFSISQTTSTFLSPCYVPTTILGTENDIYGAPDLAHIMHSMIPVELIKPGMIPALKDLTAFPFK